jgi:hypothetical protein
MRALIDRQPAFQARDIRSHRRLLPTVSQLTVRSSQISPVRLSTFRSLHRILLSCLNLPFVSDALLSLMPM